MSKSEVPGDKNLVVETIEFTRASAAEFVLKSSSNGSLLIASGQNDKTMTLGPVQTGTGAEDCICMVATDASAFNFDKAVTIQGGIEVSAGNVILPAGCIGESMLAAESVTTDKIADGNVTHDKLSGDSVSSDKIVNASVTEQKLATDSVTAEKIANGNVSADKLAANSVTTEKILDGNITRQKLADYVVDNTKLANDSVIEVKLAAGAVINEKIRAGTISKDRLTAELQSKIDTTLSSLGGDITGNLSVNGSITGKGDLVLSGASLNGETPKFNCADSGLEIANGAKDVRVTGNVRLSGGTASGGEAGQPSLICSDRGLKIDNGSSTLDVTGNVTLASAAMLTASTVRLNTSETDRSLNVSAVYDSRYPSVRLRLKSNAILHEIGPNSSSDQNGWAYYLTSGTYGHYFAGCDGPGAAFKETQLIVYGEIDTTDDITVGGKLWLWDRSDADKPFKVCLGRFDRSDGAPCLLYPEPSDARLKQNVTELSGSLDRVGALRPVAFEWNETAYAKFTAGVEDDCRSAEGTAESDALLWEKERQRIRKQHAGLHRGFIAQELEEIFPEWVTTDDEGHKKINMSEFEAVLVKALQEMRAEYRSEIGRLKTTIEFLEKKLKHAVA